jgi:hypothetical protein
MSRLSAPVLHRLGIASRILAACVGGYALTALAASAFALLLPHLTPASRADGVLIASLLSFALYTVVALWVFCARSAWRAWRGLALAALAAGLPLWALQAWR